MSNIGGVMKSMSVCTKIVIR